MLSKKEQSDRVGLKAIAIYRDLQIPVTVVGEQYSHNKRKFLCESDSVINKFLVDANFVVFEDSFKK